MRSSVSGMLVAALAVAAGCGKNPAESKDASPVYAPDAGRDLSPLRDEMSAAARALRTAQANEEKAAGKLAATCAERADSADCKAVLGKLKALGGDAGDDPRAIRGVARELAAMLPLGDGTLTDETRALATALDSTADAVEQLDRLSARLRDR